MGEREATVLFADVSGSTRLYETAGDAVALDGISLVLAALKEATGAMSGRVVKTIGDEVMAVFASPESAVSAAAEMQARIAALPQVAGTKIGVKIGLHTGPVLQRDDDLFGDTVNLAARLVQQAQGGEIITTAETAARLGAGFRAMVRRLYSIPVKGKAEPVELAEVMWRGDANATVFSRPALAPPPGRAGVRLVYRGRDYVRRRDSDSIVLGREGDCGLVVDDEKASRQHCTIERRADKILLHDHSTNGTYVTIDGDAELCLRREQLTLRRHGYIALGQPRTASSEVVEFFCD